MGLKQVFGRLFGGNAEAHTNTKVAANASSTVAASAATPAAADATEAAEQARLAGNAALAAGKDEDAFTHYERFVQLAPRNASAHVNRAFALMRLGRLAEAEAGYRDARALDPAQHDAALFLGLCLEQQQRFQEATEPLRACVQLAPSVEEAWLALARVQERSGLASEARATLRRATAHDPGFAAAWRELTRLGLLAEDWVQALAAAEQHLALRPDSAPIHGMRSEALRRLRRFDEALAAADRAIALDAGDGGAWLTRGSVLFELRRREEGLVALRQAAQCAPDDPAVLSGLAFGEIAFDRCEEGIAWAERALTLSPAHADAFHNKALAMTRLLRMDEALSNFDRAVALSPEHPTLRFDRAMALLADARWAPGWQEYEWRLRLPGYGEPAMARGLRRVTPNETLQGQTLLLTVEQGLGDTLQFIRYVPLVLARGAQVRLMLPPRLRALFPEPWPGYQFVDEGDRIRVDAHAQLMSLPHLLQVHEPLPMQAPYVQADASRLPHWRERVDAKALLRVGLAWAGNPDHPDDARRSLTLEPLRQALADLPGVQFVSLQLNTPARDDNAARAWPELMHIGTEQRDMADTAALVQALDLVISVDTSIAHLVGALHRPLWLLLQRCPDWRWGLHGERTPWYPATRLFRQPQAGDWAGVLAQVRNALQALHPQRLATPA